MMWHDALIVCAIGFAAGLPCGWVLKTSYYRHLARSRRELMAMYRNYR